MVSATIFCGYMSSETTGSTGFYELLAWLEQNKKQLAIAFVVAVVVGFGIAVYRWQSHQTELAASDALLKLRPASGAAEKSSSPAGTEFLKVVDQFPSTDAAGRALLLAAGTLFTENKYAEALVQFEKFFKEHGNHALVATAVYGKAASLEAQGKPDEALNAYQELVTKHPQSAVVTDARFGIARVYEAKKQPELALKTYEDMARTNIASAKGNEALIRKEQLLARYPQLVQTNAVAASPTNAPAPLSTNAPVQPQPQLQPAVIAPNTPGNPANPPETKP